MIDLQRLLKQRRTVPDVRPMRGHAESPLRGPQVQVENSLVAHVRHHFSRDLATLSDSDVHRLVRLGMLRAAWHGFATPRQMAQYVDLSVPARLGVLGKSTLCLGRARSASRRPNDHRPEPGCIPIPAFAAPAPPPVAEPNVIHQAIPLSPVAALACDRVVGVGRQDTHTTLYSDSFASGVPVAVYRANPAHTTLRHALTSLNESDLETALNAAPNPQLAVVIGRDPTVSRDAYWQGKIRFGYLHFLRVAARHPGINFMYLEVRSDNRLRVRVVGNPRSIAVEDY